MHIAELRTEELWLKPRDAAPRSLGLHVSDIIRDLENTITKPGKRKPFAELSADERRRMGNYTSVGFAWESIIRRTLVEMFIGGDSRFIAAGELECEGIVGSPDWLDTVDWAIEEFKCTWRSSRRDIVDDFWSWWVQIKAYCYMSGCDRARLRVLFLNGDYQDSGPQVKQWQAIFGERELSDNWRMLRQHGEVMRRRENG